MKKEKQGKRKRKREYVCKREKERIKRKKERARKVHEVRTETKRERWRANRKSTRIGLERQEANALLTSTHIHLLR